VTYVLDVVFSFYNNTLSYVGGLQMSKPEQILIDALKYYAETPVFTRDEAGKPTVTYIEAEDGHYANEALEQYYAALNDQGDPGEEQE
jgi:hypothetical protein